MPKLILKILITSCLILVQPTNSMNLNKSHIIGVILKSKCRLFSTESEKVALALTLLDQALSQQGYKNYKIEVMNRKLQSLMCQQTFCCYTRKALGEAIFTGDKTAACLCTRKTIFDTKLHVIQAKKNQ